MAAGVVVKQAVLENCFDLLVSFQCQPSLVVDKAAQPMQVQVERNVLPVYNLAEVRKLLVVVVVGETAIYGRKRSGDNF